MAKVKLDLYHKTPVEVLTASSAHISAMATPKAQKIYETPDPTVAEHQAKHDALAAGINLVTTLEAQLLAARNALPVLTEALKESLEKRAAYVEKVSDGDPVKIPVSGFALAASTSQSIGQLPAPGNVRAVMGRFPQEVKVSCDPVRGTKTYVLECRRHDVPGDPWVQVMLSTKTRNTVTGLTTGVSYAFRMAAIGTAGQSPWSDEAVCMAP